MIDLDYFLRKSDGCATCLWHKAGFVPPTLILGSEILLYGEAPGGTELREKKGFIGASGMKLNELLEAAGIDRSIISISNSVKCTNVIDKKYHTPEGEVVIRPELEKPKDDVVFKCHDEFLSKEVSFLREHGLKLVIATGNYALQSILGLKGIQKKRGKLYPIEWAPGVVCMPTFHPAYVIRKPGVQGVVIEDLQKAVRYLKGEQEAFEAIPTIVYSLEGVRKWFDKLRSKPWLAYDLETTGFNWVRKGPEPKDTIRCIGIGWGEGKREGIIIPVEWMKKFGEEDELRGIVKDFLESYQGKLRGNNLKFDLHHTREWCGLDTDKVEWDELSLLGLAIDEEGPRNLEDLATIHAGLPGHYKQLFLGDANAMTMPLAACGKYCGSDLIATNMVANRCIVKLQSDYYHHKIYREILIPMQRSMMESERRGVYVDLARAWRVERFWRERCEEYVETMREVSGKPDLNPNSVMQVKKVLFDEFGLTNYGTTEQQILKDLHKGLIESGQKGTDPEVFLGALIDHRVAEKLLDTYIWKLINSTCPDDSRMHPDVIVCGTVSLRHAMKAPPLNTLPRDRPDRFNREVPSVRSFIGSAPGDILTRRDYKQAEFRILALLSNDQGMLDAFAQGIDFHTYTASQMTPEWGPKTERKKEVEQLLEGQLSESQRFSLERESRELKIWVDDARTNSKTYNFALVYGGSPVGIAEQLGLDIAEAERFMKERLSRFPGLQRFFEDIPNLAVETGQLESPWGWKRRFKNADIARTDRAIFARLKNQAINFLPQHIVAMIANQAWLRIAALYQKYHMKSRLILLVHDELITDGPYVESRNCMEIMEEEMSRPVPELDGYILPSDFKHSKYLSNILV